MLRLECTCNLWEHLWNIISVLFPLENFSQAVYCRVQAGCINKRRLVLMLNNFFKGRPVAGFVEHPCTSFPLSLPVSCLLFSCPESEIKAQKPKKTLKKKKKT